MKQRSWFHGRTFSEGIRAALGENTHIEDLWIPFFCTVTNITEADLNVSVFATKALLKFAFRFDSKVCCGITYVPR
jgi:hypothetical protein